MKKLKKIDLSSGNWEIGDPKLIKEMMDWLDEFMRSEKWKTRKKN